jgi:hypothetical protein
MRSSSEVDIAIRLHRLVSRYPTRPWDPSIAPPPPQRQYAISTGGRRHEYNHHSCTDSCVIRGRIRVIFTLVASVRLLRGVQATRMIPSPSRSRSICWARCWYVTPQKSRTSGWPVRIASARVCLAHLFRCFLVVELRCRLGARRRRWMRLSRRSCHARMSLRRSGRLERTDSVSATDRQIIAYEPRRRKWT